VRREAAAGSRLWLGKLSLPGDYPVFARALTFSLMGNEIGDAEKEAGAIMTSKESLVRRPLDRLGTSALVRRLVTQVETLAKKEFELAKTEVRADLHKEATAAGGLGIAAVVGIIAVALLLVTVILALSLVMRGWAAGLIVSGATLAVAVVLALVSWGRRVRDPLARTRQSMKENVKWTRERLA
jgi:hypothetical protein